MRCEKGVIWECRRVISASRAHSPYVPAVTPSSMSMLTTYKSLSVTESMYSIPFTQLDRGFCLTTVTEKQIIYILCFYVLYKSIFLLLIKDLKSFSIPECPLTKGLQLLRSIHSIGRNTHIFLSNRVIPHCWNSHLQVKSCIQNLI